MRKVCAAILSAAICLSVSGAPAWASEHQSTLSTGYLHARTNAPGSDNLNGINVKYRYEFTDTLGLVTSFSYANAKDEQKTHYSDTRWHEDSVPFIHAYRRPRHHAEPAVTHGIFMPAGIAVMRFLLIFGIGITE